MSTVADTVTLKRDLGLVGWQIRYEQRAYWRNRGRGIFTFVFPLMFLVIFASLDKGAHISSRGGIPYDDFFVPGILAYGVIATTFVNLAISTAILRDEGVLKRMQGTPLPRWAYVAAGSARRRDRAGDDGRRARRSAPAPTASHFRGRRRCPACGRRCCSAPRRSRRSGSGSPGSSRTPRPGRSWSTWLSCR